MEELIEKIKGVILEESKTYSSGFDPENPYSSGSTQEDLFTLGHIVGLDWVLCELEKMASDRAA